MGKIADITTLLEVTNGDKDFAYSMIQVFLDEADANIAIFESCLKEKDLSRLSAFAHKLKPSVSYMAIPLMRDQILKLELQQQPEGETWNLLEGFMADFKVMIAELKEI